MEEKRQNSQALTERELSGVLLRFGRGTVVPLSVLGALLVATLVWLTGGPSSPVLFLFVPLVMLPAVYCSRTVGIALSFFNSAVYSSLVWAMLEGVVPPGDGSAEIVLPQGGLVLQIVGLTSGMILVSVLTSFLVQRLTTSLAEAEQSNRDLSVLSAKQASVINEFPEAVVITSVEGLVTNLNHAAATLLGAPIEDVQGEPARSVLSRFVSGEVLSELSHASSERTQEVETAGDTPETVRKIRVTVRPVFDAEGVRNGQLYVLQDVTELRSAEEQLALQERMAQLLSERSRPVRAVGTRLEQFVGESTVMQKVFKLIERVAPSDATVLIYGESGTGKELVARSLHLGSARSSGPFVPVNCGAIPENLIESELFGHRKGAFTGADTDYNGLFRQADGGTIFLDEIGELPLSMQAKLLRAIQEKSVRPVGSNRDIPINVRIVAATNRNLKREVEEARFREDLFYRLNVININLPPLRERKEDIPFLVNSILKRLVRADRTPVVPPATMQLLLGHNYPGNVRELENILERAVVLGGEVILPEHLPESLKSAETPHAQAETKIIIDEDITFPVKLDDLLATIERRYLESALSKTNGAKKKAADLLGVNFRSFRYRLDKFGMNDEER